jgi:hypothetical protein
MEPTQPAVVPHLPAFATAPGQTDVLSIVVVIFLVVMLLVAGNLYLRLHALPERMAHRTNRVQLEIVAVLALLALFTHNHLFWIAALLLAFIEFPDIGTYAASIARSLERIANRDDRPESEPSSGAEPAPLRRQETQS